MVQIMRSTDEILEDIKNHSDIPKGYSLLEIHCFLCLKRIIIMYQNNQVSKEQAGGLKQKINMEYEQKKKEYEFQQQLFGKHIEDISKTENLRVMLRKKMQEQTPITEERLGELLSICLELIECYSGEVFR